MLDGMYCVGDSLEVIFDDEDFSILGTVSGFQRCIFRI